MKNSIILCNIVIVLFVSCSSVHTVSYDGAIAFSNDKKAMMRGNIFTQEENKQSNLSENDIIIVRDIQRSRKLFPEVFPGGGYPFRGKWVGSVHLPRQAMQQPLIKFWYNPPKNEKDNYVHKSEGESVIKETHFSLIPIFSDIAYYVSKLRYVEIKNLPKRYIFHEFFIPQKTEIFEPYYKNNDLPVKVADFSIDGESFSVCATKMKILDSSRSVSCLEDMMCIPEQELIIIDEINNVHAKFSRTDYTVYTVGDFDGTVLLPCIAIFNIILNLFEY